MLYNVPTSKLKPWFLITVVYKTENFPFSKLLDKKQTIQKQNPTPSGDIILSSDRLIVKVSRILSHPIYHFKKVASLHFQGR